MSGVLRLGCFVSRAALHTTAGCSNAYRASLGKIKREKYVKQYQVMLMRPDGSTIMGRCAEPRRFLQLPVDMTVLTEDERRQRIAGRKRKVKQVKEECIDDNFDLDTYASLFKQGSSNS
ncbi:Protein MRPL-55 [Aphelenchoides avenae]|nr:Protein MRPL-55 [Aphelenchus avenae]